MPIHVQWDASYSVGNALLDRQHQKLLNLCNELQDCLEAEPQAARFRFHGILHELMQYAQVHFRTEEDLMQRCAYAELASHQLEHDAFEQQIADWAYAATMDSMNIAEVQRYIAQWWQSHILVSDMGYKGLLESRPRPLP